MLKNLLQAIIDRIKPCEHEWELLTQTNYFKDVIFNGDIVNKQVSTAWTYRCKKCCDSKIISSKIISNK